MRQFPHSVFKAERTAGAGLRVTACALLVGLLLSLLSCGYTLQGGGSALPADVRVVFIPMAENNTPESQLTGLVTEALRDFFGRFGVIEVVDDLQSADAVLHTRILSLNRETRNVTSGTDTALKLRSELTVAGELRRVTGPVLWRNNRVQVAKSFADTVDVVVTSSADFSDSSLDAADLAQLDSAQVSRGQEREVFEQLAEEVARVFYDEAVAPEF